MHLIVIEWWERWAVSSSAEKAFHLVFQNEVKLHQYEITGEWR